ncbi:type I-E CRISPR-associated protein Cse1/CasA [Slackia exigua]|uniref:type I-E CRISPR-associated protein Cse1/CasA n=1 Tax=Slackia exigua TaxID=84109 RepID=UPI00254BC8DD|nr:type I-E CRISPR-associated protein Cse1/CasA [Slackia exigua]MDK7723953.1 type I-E CRISPR-associated protein Cse1/CasA [Slackia exigua]MDK7725184.1 type I-E CRISPR-associated protein Cse1/CasA [Slackia exigua]
MSEDVHFNLVDEPWIRVRDMRGISRELSLWDLFACAGELKCLANDLPTQDIAILRLLLAILQRSLSPSLDEDDDPAEVWARLWEAHTLPVEEIHSYLEKWRHRFDLFDPDYPFMQVAGMRTSKDDFSAVTKIIADIPDNEPLFSLVSGKGCESLSFAEATRWLVHVHAYDTAGIKSGVVGDPNAKGGKSYPIGTGWCGNLGGLLLEGTNLHETLILNFILCGSEESELFPDNDLPVWERDLKEFGGALRCPDGRADIFTWQSRRVLLMQRNSRVVGAILTNGDKLESRNMNHREPMTAWRRSKNQEKKFGLPLVYLPASHNANRALWRGLSSVLEPIFQKGDAVSPGILTWAHYLSSSNGGNCFPIDARLIAHAIGLEYGTQSSVVTNLIDDKLEMSSYLLSPEGAPLVNFACGCVEKTEEAVKTLGSLAVNLYLASGGDSESSLGVREAAKSRAFFEIDRLFRVWFSALGSRTNAEAARAGWYAQLRDVLMRLAQELIGEAGPAAVRGSQLKNKKDWMTAGKAEARFYATLDCILSCGSKEEKVKEG